MSRHLISKLRKPLLATALIVTASTSAFAESRTYTFPPFDQVNASAGVDVVVSFGDTQDVRVEANDASVFSHLNFTHTQGRLSISTDYNLLDFILGGGLLAQMFKSEPDLTVHITLPELSVADASSGADLLVENMSGASLSASASSGADINLVDAAYQNISLSASSGADINANGTCITISANVSSGADINARNLQCETGAVSASSGGDIDVYISKTAQANASSGGDIDVYGSPSELDANSSSGGDIDLKS